MNRKHIENNQDDTAEFDDLKKTKKAYKYEAEGFNACGCIIAIVILFIFGEIFLNIIAFLVSMVYWIFD